MNIRKATMHDVDALSLLFDAYRIFYKKPTDFNAAKEFLTERISNNESEIFIAETIDSKIAGFVQLYPLFSSTRLKRLWLLNDLFIDPEYRSQGISVLLIDRAKQLARETNAVALTLETAKTNTIGNALYPKTGFVLDTDHNFYEWEV
ncbi:MAG TPA: GNAT family N-acetyltransferase [Saprospiraceae bacterium]|nr:GNAT family N-acetyltransferase [Saprospiraceae bacterium]